MNYKPCGSCSFGGKKSRKSSKKSKTSMKKSKKSRQLKKKHPKKGQSEYHKFIKKNYPIVKRQHPELAAIQIIPMIAKMWSAGHRSTMKSFKKSSRKSVRSRKSMKSMKSYRKSARKSLKFGKISDTFSFMANNNGNPMSTFQQYTGLPPQQMIDHMASVPPNLRSNFYTNGN